MDVMGIKVVELSKRQQKVHLLCLLSSKNFAKSGFYLKLISLVEIWSGVGKINKAEPIGMTHGTQCSCSWDIFLCPLLPVAQNACSCERQRQWHPFFREKQMMHCSNTISSRETIILHERRNLVPTPYLKNNFDIGGVMSVNLFPLDVTMAGKCDANISQKGATVRTLKQSQGRRETRLYCLCCVLFGRCF